MASLTKAASPVPSRIPPPPPFVSKALFASLLAGWSRGIVYVAVGHPLDLIKTRLQLKQMSAARQRCIGVIATLSKVVSKEGPFALYRGAQSPLLSMPIYSSALFFSYELGRSLFYRENEPHTVGQSVSVGLFSGFFSMIIGQPIDLVKVRMQAQKGQIGSPTLKYRSSIDCAARIYRRHGLGGFRLGLSATFWRNMPGNVVFFMAFERGSDAFRNLGVGAHTSALLGGALSGLSYWLVALPSDTIRAVMMTDKIDPSRRRYSGMIDCAKSIISKNGYSGLYRGLSACMLRSVPTHAAGFFTYSLVRDLLMAM